MANKELKASVKLDTSKAVSSLDKLEKKINRLNKIVNQSNSRNSGLTNAFNRMSKSAEQVAKQSAKIDSANKKAANSANKLASNYKKSNKAVSVLTKNLRTLVSTYLGLMGAKAVLNTSDILTSSKNKLNYLNGGNTSATQLTMDKTYAAAQRSRGNYTDMISNVSKSMTLAGDSFQGNIDNAIRFQEIMSKAYTIGGASAAEQSSSMYQMIQALGSGILQGDELRSVREGAPLAYKAIEKFAQGVYKTTDSLKDMASEGKITSDMVVAAVMDMGSSVDEAFANTDMTFAQAFTSIRNMAVKAFEPVLQVLNDALNSDAGKAIVSGIGQAFVTLANIILNVFTIVKNVYNFVVNNLPTISKIILTIGTVIAVALLPKFVAWIIHLALVIKQFAILGAQAMVAAIKTAIAWTAANIPLLIMLAILAAIIITIIWVADSFVDACGIIVGCIYWVLSAIHNVVALILNIITALIVFITTAAGNIALTFINAFNKAKVAFWEFVKECLDGTSLIARAVSKIASIFGLDAVSIDTKINAAKANIHDLADIDAATSKAFETFQYADPNKMYAKGYGYGAAGGQWLTDKANALGDWFKNGGLLGNLGSGSYLPGAYDPAYAVDGAYDPSKALKGIKGDTGDIKNALDLTEEDLEYLRKIAEMEWKKEYTTANITVDMSNYNTINGESDLDGIVTKLADKLYEEMNVVANGVYA